MSCHGNIICTVVGVFPVELVTGQVSMVCAANWPRERYSENCYIVGVSV